MLVRDLENGTLTIAIKAPATFTEASFEPIAAIKNNPCYGLPLDKPLDPVPIGPLGAEGKAFEPHHLPALLLQPEFRVGDKPLGRTLRPLRLNG